jgi:hypothetical protein
VISVTGVKAGEVSAKLTLHEGDQFLIERIAGPTEQTLGGHPQMREVIHDLGLAGCGRQDESAALPVHKAHSIVAENPVRRRIGVAGENAGSGDGVGPVLRPAENAAQCAHDRSANLLSAYAVYEPFSGSGTTIIAAEMTVLVAVPVDPERGTHRSFFTLSKRKGLITSL